MHAYLKIIFNFFNNLTIAYIYSGNFLMLVTSAYNFFTILIAIYAFLQLLAFSYGLQLHLITKKNMLIICDNYNYKVVVIYNTLLQPNKIMKTRLQTCLRYNVVYIQPSIT